jgi:lipoprotein-anchoring transpeptidase ErfK/SrfK
MSAHTFTVFVPGQAPRVMPASMGKPGHETPVGTFPVLSRERTVIMDSRTIGIPLSSPDGYDLSVNFAERLTSGGVYVHSAPWSVAQQGHSNVSHGCVNLAPADAEWYYNTVGIGDPVTVHW